MNNGEPGRDDTPLPRLLSATSAAAMVLVVILVVLGSGAAVTWRDYQETLSRAREQQENLAELAERELVHAVANTDVVFDLAEERVREHGQLHHVSEGDWALFGRLSRKLPSQGRLWLFGADGRSLVNSLPYPNPVLDSSRQEYFRAHVMERRGTFISESIRGRTTGKLIFNISRRLDDAGGGLAGVMVASLDIEYFLDQFARLRLGETGAISVFRDDGALIMRQPDPAAAIGKHYPNAEVLTRMRAANAGSWTAVSPIDGVLRELTFRKLANLPLVVVVSMARDEVLAPWRLRTLSAATGGGILVLLVSALAVAMTRSIGREHRAHRSISLANLDMARANRRLQSVLGTAADGICGVDRDGNVTFINPAGAALLGFGETELLGRCLHTLSHHSRPDGSPLPIEECPVHQAMAEGEGRRVDRDVFWRKDGSFFAVEYAVAPIQGEGTGAVLTFRDVSGRLATEADLRSAKHAAEQASRAKSEFLANMSHEIRTPMTAIIGLSDLLGHTALEGRQQDYVDKIKVSARSLLGILNDILDYSKIEAGKLALNPAPFDLDTLLCDLSTVVSVGAQSKDIEVLFAVDDAVPRRLVGDDLRLQQVLINLVGNAIKFTDHGQVVVRVSLAAGVSAEGAVMLHFAVEDTGIGIGAELRQRLFQAFSQGDGSASRRFGGTGLGLAISARLVTLMGGAIGVESTPGVGSTFWFTVRLGRCAVAPGGEDRNRLKGLRVLVADDNDIARGIARDICVSLGWLPICVGSGEAAVDAFRATPAELVLMDWRMGAMDGIAAAAAIRDLTPDGSPPPVVIVVTAYDRELASSQAAEAGVAAVLTKPLAPSQLLDLVAGMLQGGPTGPGPAVPVAEKRLSGLRVLLAEDNAINREVVCDILEREGAEVIAVADGEQAVRAVRETTDPIDAVLMDMQMPVMDGVEATRAIRSAGHAVPIIAMTANAMTGDRERCLEAGMDDHIPKPIDIDLLVSTLLRRLDRRAPIPAASVATASAGVAELPGIDLADVRRRLGGNDALLSRLLRRLAEEHAGDDVRIAAALDAGDLPAARGLAHVVKGLAGNLGARRLAAAAAAVQGAIDAGKPAGAALAEFGSALAEVVAGVGAEAAPVDGQGPCDVFRPAGEVRDRLVRLLDRVRGRDFSALDAFTELRDLLPPGEAREQLRVSLDRLDFPRAQEVLESWLEHA